MHHATDTDDYTYVYKYMFKTYYMQLPFSNFECSMLTIMDVAPSQLHPNSWAFLRAFQILCHFLHIRSAVNKFMFFYQLKKPNFPFLQSFL